MMTIYYIVLYQHWRIHSVDFFMKIAYITVTEWKKMSNAWLSVYTLIKVMATLWNPLLLMDIDPKYKKVIILKHIL